MQGNQNGGRWKNSQTPWKYTCQTFGSIFCSQTFWTDAFREGLQKELEHVDSSDASGIDAAYMRKVAAGQSGFSFEDACQICDDLGISPNEILRWDERKRMTTDHLTDIVIRNEGAQDG